MILEILIAIACGVLMGTFTGLIPGIHINLISALVLGISGSLSKNIPLFVLGVFIMSMSITHTFLDSIPGIFLGAPDEAHALTILPGHRMLLQGKGNEAVSLTIIGSYFSLVICIVLIPLLIIATKNIYPLIKAHIGYILMVVVLYIIIQGKNRLASFLVFILSGILGLVVLNMKTIENPLFPLLSGLFGFSVLIESLRNKNEVPKQKDSKTVSIETRNIVHAVSSATLFGFIASFLPGFGSSQAAILASKAIQKSSIKTFLILVGGINTVNMALSLVTLYTIGKARNGAVLAVSEIIKDISLNHLLAYLLVSLISGSVSVILALKISRMFSGMITKIDYSILVRTILIFIIFMTFILSGPLGLLILATATSTGITAEKLEVGKNNCLGCLILPVIMFFVM